MDIADAGGRAERLKQQFQEEVRSLKSGDQWRRWLNAAATFHDHAFENVVLIAAQRPEATRIADADTWHKVGRHIDADEEAIQLLSPVSTNSDKQTGTISATQVIEYWDISQTFGGPLPASLDGPSRHTGQVPDRLWSKLASIARGLGFHASREPVPSPDLASVVDYEEGAIIIAGDFNDGEAVAMLAHELAHVVMHASQMTNPTDSVQNRDLLELEALSVEYLVLKPHGISREPAFNVVADWIRAIDPRYVEQRVQDLAHHVLAVARPIMDGTSPTMLEIDNIFAPIRNRHLVVAPARQADPEPPIDRGP